MKKLLFTAAISFIVNSYASCPLLTNDQLKTATTYAGYKIDSDYSQAIYGFNQDKCLYQIRSHKDSVGFILTYNPITNQIQNVEQKGSYSQYFDDDYVNYSN